MNGGVGHRTPPGSSSPLPHLFSSPSPSPPPPSSPNGGPPSAFLSSPPLPPLPPLPSYVPPHLSPSALCSLLQLAQSSEELQRVQAMRKMEEFHQMSIMLSGDRVDEELRLLAAIELKNRLDGFFAALTLSSSSPSGWGQKAEAGDERETLKVALLERMEERSEAISTQRALCISIVAKYEGTKQWPTLLPSLLSMASLTSSSDRLLSLRSSYALHCVLKVLQAKRTPTAKANFASLTQTALPVVSQLASHHLRRLCEVLQQANGRLSEGTLSDLSAHSRMANLHIKASYRLLAYGVVDVSGSSEALQLFSLLGDVVRFLFPIYANIPPSHPLRSSMASLLLSLLSIPLEVQKVHPLPFRVFLSDCVQMADFLLVQSLDGLGELLFEELVVLSCTFLSNVVKEPVYQSGTASGVARSALTFSLSGGLRVDPAAASEAQSIFSRLFTPAFVLHLSGLFLSNFFPPTPSEIRRWSSDAEQSILDQQLDEQKARPAALRLFGLLSQLHPDDVSTFILQSTQQLLTSSSALSLSPSSPSPASPLSSSSLPDIAGFLRSLTSVYSALGSLCYELPPRQGKSSPAFSFDSFFHQMARPQLLNLLNDTTAAHSSNNRHNSNNVELSLSSAARCALICRLYWCVGEWCESFPVSSHGAVYDSVGLGLAHFDLAVRFAALRCLERFVVSVVGLEEGGGQAAAVYSAYVEGVFRVCVGLIGQLEELELQTSTMQIIRHSVAAIHYKVEPAVPLLLSALPFLWETAGQKNNPLRLALLDTVTQLTKSLGHRSNVLLSFSMQVVAFSLDPKANDRGYLHSVALELWAALLQTATTFTPALLDLFPLLPSVFADEGLDFTEALPIGLSLIESYALLGGRDFMNSQADTVATLMSGWMGRVAEKGLLPLSCTLETLAQLFPVEFHRVFARPLHFILGVLMEVQRFSELREEDKAQASHSIALPSDLVVGHLLYVFSRLFYQSGDAGMEVLRSFAASQHSSTAAPSTPSTPNSTATITADLLLNSLLRLWLDKMDCVSEVYKRKLAVLAIGRILRSQRQSEAVLVYVSEWVVAATGIQLELDTAEANDVENGRDHGSGGRTSSVRDEGDEEYQRLSVGTEVERRRRLNEMDAASSAVVLSEAVDVLSQLQQSQSPSAFHHLVQQRIPLPIQRSVDKFLQQQNQAGQRAQEAQQKRGPSPPLSATLPLQPSSFSSTLPSSSSTLPTSHSHPSLNSVYPHHRA